MKAAVVCAGQSIHGGGIEHQERSQEQPWLLTKPSQCFKKGATLAQNRIAGWGVGPMPLLLPIRKALVTFAARTKLLRPEDYLLQPANIFLRTVVRHLALPFPSTGCQTSECFQFLQCKLHANPQWAVSGKTPLLPICDWCHGPDTH